MLGFIIGWSLHLEKFSQLLYLLHNHITDYRIRSNIVLADIDIHILNML